MSYYPEDDVKQRRPEEEKERERKEEEKKKERSEKQTRRTRAEEEEEIRIETLKIVQEREKERQTRERERQQGEPVFVLVSLLTAAARPLTAHCAAGENFSECPLHSCTLQRFCVEQSHKCVYKNQ